MLLLLAAVSSGDGISQVKLGRVTEQSVALLRNLKSFFNLQFRIEQCTDDVYSDSDDEDEAGDDNDDGDNEAPPQFPQTFIFSCIGIGLTNFARRQE